MSFPVHPWKVVERGWQPNTQRFAESLMSLANGYMGLRGNFEEDYSGDSICVITKAYEGRELLLVFNPTNGSVSVSLEGLSVQNHPIGELSVLGELLTGEEKVAIDGNTVTMPAFSILVMGVA